MISHMTGANGNVVSLTGLEKDPLAIMLVMDNGDAQFLLTAPPPEESEDQEKIDSWMYALNLTNYLTHCLHREDWFDEFADNWTAIVEDMAREHSEEEAQKKRSGFKLLKGGVNKDED